MTKHQPNLAGVKSRGERGRRGEVLAAAVASVVSEGYSRTTVSQVARRAGVPRPLVQYYFPTRELMLRAAIHKILDDWRDSYFARPHGAPAERENIGEGVERLWNHMHEPTYRAYQELQSAARTDPALAAIIAEIGTADAHLRHDQAASTYALFAADSTAFADARAFTTIFLEGLLHHRFGLPAESSTAERQRAMLIGLLADYWARHGVAASDGDRQVVNPSIACDARRHAQDLIPLLQGLIKTLG